MQCPSCGNVLEATDRFCPVCGAALNAGAQNAQSAQNVPGVQNAPGVPMHPPAYAYGMQNGGQPFCSGPEALPNQPPLTRKMFFSMWASAKARRGIRSSAILCYICAVLTGVYGLLILGNPFVLLDTVILVLLGVFIHVKQSKAAAVILLLYSAWNTISTLVNTGVPGGWMIVLVGIDAVYATFLLDKEYKAYQGR